MRISTTAIESFRLWSDPEQEWMSEADLIATITKSAPPSHNVLIGSAFGTILEHPDKHRVAGGYQCGEFAFGRDVVEPCLAVIDRRGVFEAKAAKSYGDCDVVARADHLYGAHLSEFKTTLSTFDAQKYLDSCQWRFYFDIFEPRIVTYHVFCLSEATNGVIDLRGVESFNVYSYPELHDDCRDLVARFASYARARGLEGHLRQRQVEAA
jgi:hypothetical protein